MQVALLSDIHGNLTALDAVLEQLAAERIEKVICLGDVALSGPRPREVIARLAEAADVFIMGNTDAWALDPHPFPQRNEDTQRIYELELWGAEQLGSQERAVLRSFEPTARVNLDGAGELLAYHGSPHSFNDGILPTMSDQELDTHFQRPLATVLAGGHIHEPFVRRYRQSHLLNPGSVGMPFLRRPDGGAINPAWAEYALLRIEHGAPQIELRRVAYDLDRYVTDVRDSGMPHARWWLSRWRPARIERA